MARSVALPLTLLLVLGACDPKGPDVPVSATSSTTSLTPPTDSSGVQSAASGRVPDASAMTKRPCVKTSKLGRDLEVGPGAKLATLSDVPWETLGPGDTVRVRYKPEPYRDKILISQSGTSTDPIVLCGIAGPKGERPIIDGHDAVTRKELAFTYEPQQDRGLIVLSLDNSDRYGFKPSHIVIEGLEVRNAHPEHGFTGMKGDKRTFLPLAAGIFIERGEDVTVRDCAIHHNGNGFFVASGDDEARLSRRILFEGNDVYQNGTAGQGFDRRHNIYSEAVGMTYQFNHVGPLREGAGGSALKDRSAGTVIRYNFIEGGARQLDLVEAEDGYPMMKDLPEYNDAYVYGNVLVSHDDTSNVVHFGGDNGLEEKYRRGTLYFYANTVVVEADQQKRWRTAIFQLATNAQTVDVRDNVFFATSSTVGAPATNLTLMNQSGHAVVKANAATSGLNPFAEGIEVKGKVDGIENVVKLDGSPFIDREKRDLRPKPGCALIGAAVELAPKSPPVNLEYVPHLGSKPRTVHDVGALEH